MLSITRFIFRITQKLAKSNRMCTETDHRILVVIHHEISSIIFCFLIPEEPYFNQCRACMSILSVAWMNAGKIFLKHSKFWELVWKNLDQKINPWKSKLACSRENFCKTLIVRAVKNLEMMLSNCFIRYFTSATRSLCPLYTGTTVSN